MIDEKVIKCLILIVLINEYGEKKMVKINEIEL